MELLLFLNAGWSSRSGASSSFSACRLLILLLSLGKKKSLLKVSRSSVYGGGWARWEWEWNSECDCECLTPRCSFFLRSLVEQAWPIFAIGISKESKIASEVNESGRARKKAVQTPDRPNYKRPV